MFVCSRVTNVHLFSSEWAGVMCRKLAFAFLTYYSLFLYICLDLNPNENDMA